jgi:hypothetical protein
MQGGSDGRLAAVDTQLAAGIVNMEIDRPFRQTQDDAHFPTGFPHGSPLQAGFFPLCKRLHWLRSIAVA